MNNILYNTYMKVKKRNGSVEEVSFDKILRRIKSLCNGKDLNNLSIHHF